MKPEQPGFYWYRIRNKEMPGYNPKWTPPFSKWQVVHFDGENLNRCTGVHQLPIDKYGEFGPRCEPPDTTHEEKWEPKETEACEMCGRVGYTYRDIPADYCSFRFCPYCHDEAKKLGGKNMKLQPTTLKPASAFMEGAQPSTMIEEAKAEIEKTVDQ